jgi:hypothetical protein
LVQVYYSEGEFKKSANRNVGTKIHDITIEIDMTASAKATVDLSILDSNTATEYQKAAALAELKEAAERADEKCDELIDAVYQIFMDARNKKLNLPVGEISSPWIDRVTKDQTIERGDLVVKTANMKYKCRIQEDVLGAIGKYADPAILDSAVPLGTDQITASGVIVENSV